MTTFQVTVFLSPLRLLAVLVALAISSHTPNAADDPKPVTESAVRDMLGGDDFPGARTLRTLGKRAFPAFETILKDPNTRPIHIARIFGTLRAVDGDRSQFHDQAIQRLGDSDHSIQIQAAALVGEIGNEKDACLLLVLLSDELTVAYSAAQALVKIGGPAELTAMNLWLKVSDHKRYTTEHQNDNNQLRKHVTKFRDELKERLDKVKKK